MRYVFCIHVVIMRKILTQRAEKPSFYPLRSSCSVLHFLETVKAIVLQRGFNPKPIKELPSISTGLGLQPLCRESHSLHSNTSSSISHNTDTSPHDFCIFQHLFFLKPLAHASISKARGKHPVPKVLFLICKVSLENTIPRTQQTNLKY